MNETQWEGLGAAASFLVLVGGRRGGLGWPCRKGHQCHTVGQARLTLMVPGSTLAANVSAGQYLLGCYFSLDEAAAAAASDSYSPFIPPSIVASLAG